MLSAVGVELGTGVAGGAADGRQPPVPRAVPNKTHSPANRSRKQASRNGRDTRLEPFEDCGSVNMDDLVPTRANGNDPHGDFDQVFDTQYVITGLVGQLIEGAHVP